MSDLAATYDLFLSYNWQDSDAVEEVAQRLKDRGLKVFLDRWGLPPGFDWVRKLEAVLISCRVVAVFMGPHGMGDWQLQELDLCLRRKAKDKTFLLIPVLLPGADLPLGFLLNKTPIDLRSGQDRDLALANLAAVAQGQTLPALQESVATTLASICPYRGLHPFREEDATFFFGRNTFTARLLAKLDSHSLLALVGPSGSGKSSVVRAGLVPEVRRKSDGEIWEVLTLVPGDRPLHSLMAALLSLLEPQMDDVDRLEAVGKLAGDLASGNITLREVVELALKKQPGTDRLLLVIDQWEELYTLNSVEQSHNQFIEALLDATKRGPLCVVLTLRADFFGYVLNNRSLGDRLQHAQVNLGPMTREELTSSIVEPAARVGLRFESGLVQRILEDVERQPGTLPLLEFALTELWQHRSGGLLTNTAYDDIGGVAGAIAQRAEEEFGKFTAEQQVIIRRIFTRLVRLAPPDEGTEDTRRRVPLEDFSSGKSEKEGEELSKIVQALTAARLLVLGRDPSTGKAMVEVAHETLIRNWMRLRGWLNDDREGLLWRQQLALVEEQWRITGKDDGSLLRGASLAQAIKWKSRLDAELNKLESTFIDASITQDKNERLAKRRRIQFTLIGLVVTLIIMSIAAVMFFSERNAAFRTISRDLAANAMFQLNIDPELSVLLTSAALKLAYTEQAEDALRRSLAESRVRATMRGHGSDVLTSTFSPDGKLVLTFSNDNSVRVWNPTTGQQITELHGHTGLIHSAAFSPDSKLIVTASGDMTARIWEATTGRVVAELKGHRNDVRTASFSPDSSLVVTGGGNITKGTRESQTVYRRIQDEDYQARVWDVKSGQCLHVLDGHSEPISDAAFSPDGQLVVTAGWDETARIWDARTAKMIKVLVGHSKDLKHAAFVADSKLVLTSSNDDTARIWDVSSGEAIGEIPINGTSKKPAAFSADGQRLVTVNTGENGNVSIWLDWKNQDRPTHTLRGHTDRVESVEFSSDNRLVVTTSRDHTSRVWDAESGRLLTVLRGHGATVWEASFSPDNKHVVTASADRTARVWEVSATPIAASISEDEFVHHVSFSPDGKLLVTANGDGVVRVWDVTTTNKVSELRVGSLIDYPNAEFSPDGNFVAVTSWEKKVLVWEFRTGRVVLTVPQETMSHSAAFSTDGKLIVITRENAAQVWEISTGKPVVTLNGHIDTVWDARFSPDGKTIVTASSDTTARIWNVSTGQSVAEFKHGAEGRLYSAAFSPDGKLIVTAGGDNKARSWDVGTGSVIEFIGHTSGLRKASFSTDGKLILTASEDGTARIWKANTGQVLASLQSYRGGANCAALSPNLTLIAVASEGVTPNSGVTQIFECDVCGSVEELLGLASKRVTRELTPAEREMYLPKP